MTDKQIIETLKNISRHCSRQWDCKQCVFNYRDSESCQVRDIVKKLSGPHYPASWDIEEIERLVKL